MLHALEIDEVVIIGSSMAGRYIVPWMIEKTTKAERNPTVSSSCLIALALSDTNKLTDEQCEGLGFHLILTSEIRISVLDTPTLILRGEWDTSLGLSAADNLSRMPNARAIVIPEAKHLCHVSQPDFFHKATLNFLDLCLKQRTKSACVSEI